MPEKILGENVTFKIEVEENPLSILLVFDRFCDHAIVPWQDAYNLAQVMEQVIADVKSLFPLTIDHRTAIEEQSQIRMAYHKGLVALVVEWTDRIRFTSLDAFLLTTYALKKTAQDAHLEQKKGIKMAYDRQGMLSKIHNLRTGETQYIR